MPQFILIWCAFMYSALLSAPLSLANEEDWVRYYRFDVATQELTPTSEKSIEYSARPEKITEKKDEKKSVCVEITLPFFDEVAAKDIFLSAVSTLQKELLYQVIIQCPIADYSDAKGFEDIERFFDAIITWATAAGMSEKIIMKMVKNIQAEKKMEKNEKNKTCVTILFFSII